MANDRPATPRPIRRLSAPITQPFPVLAATDAADDGEHVEDLIAGYALGALEPDERLAVERHAAYCPSCARLLAETRRTAAILPFVAAPAAPSPDVKAALFARISQSSAAVSAEQAAEFAWARPVSPRTTATLPASGTWLESLPESAAMMPTAVRTSRRSRPGIGRLAGISLPVLLTFGLLALFVVPRILPSDEPSNPQLVELLSNGSTECANTDLALATSPSVASACGFTNGQIQPNGSVMWTLQVNNLIDDSPQPAYSVSVPLTDGTYEVLPNQIAIQQNRGTYYFTKPENASDGSICLIERGEDPVRVCPT